MPSPIAFSRTFQETPARSRKRRPSPPASPSPAGRRAHLGSMRSVTAPARFSRTPRLLWVLHAACLGQAPTCAPPRLARAGLVAPGASESAGGYTPQRRAWPSCRSGRPGPARPARGPKTRRIKSPRRSSAGLSASPDNLESPKSARELPGPRVSPPWAYHMLPFCLPYPHRQHVAHITRNHMQSSSRPSRPCRPVTNAPRDLSTMALPA
jgi:hypothetical protein